MGFEEHHLQSRLLLGSIGPRVCPRGAFDGRRVVATFEGVFGSALEPGEGGSGVVARFVVPSDPERVRPCLLVEPLRGQEMSTLAVHFGEHGVGGVSHQSVSERQVLTSALEDLPVHQVLDADFERRSAPPHQPDEAFQGVGFSQDAGRAEDASVFAIEAAQPELNHSQDTLGEGVPGARGDQPNQLFDEEGMSICAVEDEAEIVLAEVREHAEDHLL